MFTRYIVLGGKDWQQCLDLMDTLFPFVMGHMYHIGPVQRYENITGRASYVGDVHILVAHTMHDKAVLEQLKLFPVNEAGAGYPLSIVPIPTWGYLSILNY